MSAPLNFDANQVDPNTAYDPIPAGWYTAMITESEMKPTKNGQGQYLQLSFQIIDGEHNGRILWDRLNLVNNSQPAVEISQRTLSAICHAVNELNVADSAQLHNKPMQVKVKVKPADGQYEASNEITGYKPSGQSSAPAPAATPAQPAASNTPPWQQAS